MKKTLSIALFYFVLLLSAKAQISVSTTDPTGCNKNDGKATVTVATPGFDLEYAKDGVTFQAGNTFENLSEGSYTATVRDKVTQCTFSKGFTIKKFESSLKVTISGNNGPVSFLVCESAPTLTLTASASGGSGNYDYTWAGGTKTVSSSGWYPVKATDKTTGCTADASVFVIFIPIICSRDPNDIVGPEGYGPGKMIAKSKTHSYMIRFENDPDFATAPAQVVKINHPLDSNVNLFSLRLGDFGFGGLNFTVPPDRTFYATRLNALDSLGVVVDVTAGIDATKREVFWIFESKDPATGLPPANATLGFLPVNDSSGKGEGYVNYTIKAANHTRTGDSIHAKASIIFDINAAIETPVIFNTIDAVAPVSQLNPLPAVIDSNIFEIRWAGTDDAGGSGIRDYDLYVSENNSVFRAYQTGITDTVVSFIGRFGTTYGFYTIATDNTGNREAIKIVADQVVRVIDGNVLPTGEPIVTTSPGNTVFTRINNLPPDPVVIDPAVTVTDEDNTLLASATVAITTHFVSAEDSLVFVNQNGINGIYNNGILLLSGSASVTNYATALRSIRYTNKSNTPDTVSRTVRFIVNDGLFNSAPAFKRINIVSSACQLPDHTPPVIVSKNITVNLDASGHATIQPGDVIQTVTDNCAVDNTSFTVSPNTFSCSDLSDGFHQAYIATTSTGNQNWQGELGMEFTVNHASGIVVKQLGTFDHQGNGITGTQSGGIRVAVFNKATQSIVPGLDVIVAGNADHYTANHRMKDITPVTLMPGNYVIVSKGYNANELNGNRLTGTPYAFGDAGSGAISFTGTGLYGSENLSTFGFPLNADAGPANRYLAGTFLYDVAASSNHQAYVATTSTGNQNWQGELGMEFTVNHASGIVVKQLGTFDHQGNGITGTQSGGIRVAVFNKATQSIVPGLDVIVAGNADPLLANHRMKGITPVTLMPGNYMIVSKGYNTSELNGNRLTGTPYAFGDSSSGAISFTGTGLYGSENLSTFEYPLNADAGPANRYLAGTFLYDVPANSSGSTNHQAYVANTTTGNQNWQGELGMEFTVNHASGIVVKQLGAFDHQGNGITGTQSGGIRVAVFNKATQSIVPGLDVIVAGNADPLLANHRMKGITPVTLMPGNYMIVSKGYNTSELNGNRLTGTPYAFGDAASGAISFTGTGFYGSENLSTFEYPLNADAGPANRYLAGTFLYDVPGTTASTGNRIVTISAADINGNIGYATATVTVLDVNGVCNQSPAIAAITIQPEEIKSVLNESKLSQEHLVVYPNPTNGSFNLQLYDLKASKAVVEIYNENGILVEKRSITALSKAGPFIIAKFSLVNQHAGIYFIKVTSANSVQTAKVVLQR